MYWYYDHNLPVRSDAAANESMNPDHHNLGTYDAGIRATVHLNVVNNPSP